MTKDLKRLENKIDLILAEQDKPLTSEQACEFLGIKKPTLYKLTSERVIPYYKPNGCMMYFKRADLQKYAFKNKIECVSILT